ncbi:MAG: DUF4230 domain-containing protein [Spirosomataceae bacterium]|jgi:hypothetical protein
MIKGWFKIILAVLFTLLVVFFWEKLKNIISWGEKHTETTHNILIQKITTMGNLELVKYSFKDIVEQKIVQDFLPDPKAILIVQGEAVGCIDLRKINASDISEKNDTLIVQLPKAEICYHKIDHSKSRIYDTEYAFMNESLLLDEAYKKAEEKILSSALESGILDQTQKNAELILKPFIENISGKKVILKFQLEGNLQKLK